MIADKLTGAYKPHEYDEVILPMTVIRPFDEVLSDTKEVAFIESRVVIDAGDAATVPLV